MRIDFSFKKSISVIRNAIDFDTVFFQNQVESRRDASGELLGEREREERREREKENVEIERDTIEKGLRKGGRESLRIGPAGSY